MLEKIKKFGWGYFAIGATLIGIGISFIVFSEALSALAIAVGITLTVYGILLGVITVGEKDRSLRFALKITLAIVCIIGGIVTLVMQKEAITVISDICCLLLILDGAFKLQTAMTNRRIGAFVWSVMIVFALVTIIPSYVVTKLLTASPDSAVLSVVIGVIILFDGVANLILPFLPTGDAPEKKKEGSDSNFDKPKSDRGAEGGTERYLER